MTNYLWPRYKRLKFDIKICVLGVGHRVQVGCCQIYIGARWTHQNRIESSQKEPPFLPLLSQRILLRKETYMRIFALKHVGTALISARAQNPRDVGTSNSGKPHALIHSAAVSADGMSSYISRTSCRSRLMAVVIAVIRWIRIWPVPSPKKLCGVATRAVCR